MKRKLASALLLSAAVVMTAGCGAEKKETSQTETKVETEAAATEAAETEATETEAAETEAAETEASETEAAETEKKTEAAETETAEAAQEKSGLVFQATDLNGDEVTDAVFAEKDLTVLNIWGTFCGPCIGEMPELGEWAKEMPENVQLLGLVADVNGATDTKNIELAKKIMEKAGAEFRNIAPNEDFHELLTKIPGVPTTYFIDKEGNIVGEPIVGADVEGYKKFVEEYVSGL